MFGTKYIIIVAVLTALTLMAISPSTANHQTGVCTRRLYRQISLQPLSYTTYNTRTSTGRYRCGSWPRRRRCTTTLYSVQSTVRYSARYSSQTYISSSCCPGYTGSAPDCHPVTCPSLNNPSNGTVSYGPREYRSVATYTCSFGYELYGSVTRTCQYNRVWSGSAAICLRLGCHPLSDPPNGSVSYSHGKTGDVATYNCSNGYRLVGDSSRVCQHTEIWSGSQPNCTRLICPPLSNPLNGSVSYSDGYAGDTATYTCSYGYRLVGASSRVCLVTERWNGTQPHCSRLYCPEEDNPENGQVLYTGFGFVGDTANYVCSQGYRLMGNSSRVCEVTERWSETQPTCAPVICPNLASPSNGTVHYDSRDFRSVATYACYSGYEVIGTPTRMCQFNATWSGLEPTCEHLLCPSLSDPQNGNVMYSHGYAGETATYTCMSGYRLVGASSRVCQNTERWTESQPYCSPVTCPSLPDPTNGRVSYGSRDYTSAATYTCDFGYELFGSVTHICQANGVWSGLETSCQRLLCPALGNPQYGSVSYSHGEAGDVAVYTCTNGYRLVGDSSRVCQHTEVWSGSQPNCIRLNCPPLSNPQNGFVSYSDGYAGDTATYTCSYGYRLVGASSRVCQFSEVWNGSQPHCSHLICPRLSDPRNGNVTYAYGYAGETALYSCYHGYRLVGTSSRVCQATEIWGGSQPDCSPVTCPSLMNPSNGRVSYDSRDYKSVATYTCDIGYELFGPLTRTCQANGMWSASVTTCQVLRCPPLSDPQNGHVSYSQGEAGDVAIYSCTNGYNLIGDSSRVCQHTEIWSGSQPNCIRLQCPPLSNPRNGFVSYSDGYAGDTAVYTCSSGYRLIGTSSRVCQFTERWNGSQPDCSPVSCPSLSNPSNGRVLYGSRDYGSVAAYTCDLGYGLFGSLTRTCQSNGMWSGSETTCQVLRCPPLGDPRNGHVSYSHGEAGDTAVYTCTNGYRLVGGSSRVCQHTEMWSGLQPNCTRLQCPPLSNPRNGFVSYSDGYAGDIAVYTCTSGYMLVGITTRVCQVTERWTGSQPDCSAVSCPSLTNPSNGRVVYGSRDYMSVATYTCDFGYELFGSLTRTCQSNGTWSKSETTCRRLLCPALSNPQYGSVSYSHGEAGDVATYSCSDGYRLVGGSSRVCQHTEVWSGSQPNCIRVRCPPLSSPQNGNVLYGERYAGDTAVYTCSSGFRLIGTSSRVCQFTERWNGSQPHCSRLQCPRLSDPRNGNVTYAYGYAGETAVYNCYHGYKLIGMSSRVCEESEKWSGSQPQCSRLRCPPLSNPQNGSVSYGDGYAGDTAIYSCSSGYRLVGGSSRVCQFTESWNGSQPQCSSTSNQLIQLRLIGVGDCSNWLFQLSKPAEKAYQVVDTITTNIEMCPSGKCGLRAKDFTESVFQCFAQNAHEVTFRTRLHETAQASTMELVNAITRWVKGGATMTVDGVLMKVDQTCKIGIEILSEPECQASGTSAAANNGTGEVEANNPMNYMVAIISGSVAVVAVLILVLLTTIVCIACLCSKHKKRSQHYAVNQTLSSIHGMKGDSEIVDLPPAYMENENQF